MQPTIDELKKGVLEIAESITPESISIFDPKKDDYLEPNYTLNYFPTGSILDTLSLQVEAFKKVDPNHFYIEKDKLHLTILGLIDINIDLDKLIEGFKRILAKYKVEFIINGTSYMKEAGFFTLYPVFSLYDLRGESLNLTSGSGKVYTNVFRYMGWMNFMRFLHKPKDELLEEIKKTGNKNFGVNSAGKILLLKNTSKTLRDDKFEVVHDFNKNG